MKGRVSTVQTRAEFLEPGDIVHRQRGRWIEVKSVEVVKDTVKVQYGETFTLHCSFEKNELVRVQVVK